MELPRELSLLRIVAQGLVPATAQDSPYEVVRTMLATQGQLPGAVPHSLIVRTHDSVASQVREEFASGRLVRFWPFRGTLHIVTAEDYPWVRALWATRRDSWWERVSASINFDEKHLDHARTVAQAALSSGPLGRNDMYRLWAEAGVGVQVEQEHRHTLHRVLYVQFHRDGTFVSGPLEKNEHLVMEAENIGGVNAPWAERIEAGDTDAIESGYREIARRYTVSRGPITVDDLARWIGVGKGIARRALDDAVAASNGAIVTATVDRSGLSVRAKDAPPSSGMFYLRSDLLDLLADNRKDAMRTLYLASFDELHVGYKDRTCLASADIEKLICPGANGMFRPLVVDGGKVVAVNPQKLGLLWAKEPSARLARDTERTMKRVEKRLTS